jgi:hypothetical protein
MTPKNDDEQGNLLELVDSDKNSSSFKFDDDSNVEISDNQMSSLPLNHSKSSPPTF